MTFAIIGGICLLSGFGLLALGRSPWLPVTVGVALLVAAYVGWWLSHSQADLDKPIPTTITDQTSGLELITDSRLIAAPDSVRALAKLFHTFIHRQPLPSPDGLVDERGNPLPERKAEAQERVDAINSQITSETMDTLRSLAGIDDQEAQEKVSSLNPPPTETVSKLNKATDEEE